MATGYPTDTDLSDKIESLGVADMTGAGFQKIQLDRKIAAALLQWETRTGWKPYWPKRGDDDQPVETTRPFDAPDGPILSLRGGVLSVSSVTVFGSEYVVGEDCYLQPADAPAKGEPYTEIRFLSRIASRLPQCVSVTGVWGHSLDADADAWEAILGKAAALCVPELALGISKGVYEYREGDVMKRFAGSGGGGALSAEAALWEANFKQVATDKKRITV